MSVACGDDVLAVCGHQRVLADCDVRHFSGFRHDGSAEDVHAGFAGSRLLYIRDDVALVYGHDKVQLSEIRHAEFIVLRLRDALFLVAEAYRAVLAALGRDSAGYAYRGLVHPAIDHILDVKIVDSGVDSLFEQLCHDYRSRDRPAAVVRFVENHVCGHSIGVEGYLHRAVHGLLFYFRFFCTLCLRVEILSSGRVLAHFAFVLAVFLQCIVDLVCISGIKRHYLTAILNYLTDIFVFCDNTVKTVLHLIITY